MKTSYVDYEIKRAPDLMQAAVDAFLRVLPEVIKMPIDISEGQSVIDDQDDVVERDLYQHPLFTLHADYGGPYFADHDLAIMFADEAHKKGAEHYPETIDFEHSGKRWRLRRSECTERCNDAQYITRALN